jgi:mannose-1-phosphate guanylyltransferase
MKGLILAAGKGTRLRPVTDYIPKPMVPLHGKPLLEWVLLHLISYGIREYVIAVSYFAEQIQNYFNDGRRWGINIRYSSGPSPAGKAGEIWRARNFLNKEQQFLVVPGDTITHLDYSDFIQFHRQYNGIASVALSTQYRLEVGLAQMDENNRITKFLEKTNLGCPVSTGTYLLDKAIFPFIEGYDPEVNQVDLPGDVFPLLLGKGIMINGYVRDYKWWDIGKLHDYEVLAHLPLRQAKDILYWNEINIPGDRKN